MYVLGEQHSQGTVVAQTLPVLSIAPRAAYINLHRFDSVTVASVLERIVVGPPW